MAAMENGPPVLRGAGPAPGDRESRERELYASGAAEREASAAPGASAEPWENVIALHEPLARHAAEWLLARPALGPRVRGRVLDVGAGTCWLSARISRQEAVEEVWAQDLSEEFLTSTGLRVFRHFGGRQEKLRLATGDFHRLPFQDDLFDCALLFAVLHHSLAPLKLLSEAIRCVRPGGAVFIHESPARVLHIARARENALRLSSGAATEIAYTRGELEYLVRHAALPHRGKQCRHRFHPLPSRRPRWWKAAVRAALRPMGLEDVLLPCTYVISLDVERPPA